MKLNWVPTRQCPNCGDPFTPSPHAWRQLYCSKPECQRARRRKNYKEFLSRNPGYLRSLRITWAELKPERDRKWRLAHPDYIKLWRARNQDRYRAYMREYMRRYRARARAVSKEKNSLDRKVKVSYFEMVERNWIRN